MAEARALACNGCGDCCDSRRTDGFWTWGALPADQFRSLGLDGPLIIPLGRADGGWVDRPCTPEDGAELSPTRFRCTAFDPQPDGSGRCLRHDQARPDRCGEFPVGSPALDRDLQALGEVRLQTGAFPRCTWFGMVVVHEDDPRLVRAVAG
ncbi:MAG: hypothetical protein GEU80_01340 [Dehalococcoidia bacterium]|nr:hypothetical protein [Dehalococcoidia bacterium]